MKTMAKAFISSSLALTGAGALLSLTPSASLAGTLSFTDSFNFQNTNFSDTLSVSQYNGSQPLLSIEVIVRSDAQGTYDLSRTGTSDIFYGFTGDDVGASVTVTGPSSSISLQPVPTQDIGTGTLDANNPSINLNISGTDTQSGFIDSSFFGLYTGSGTVNFNALALSNILVSKAGTPFTENADIAADAELEVIYTFQDPITPQPPTGVPEPASILGLLAFGGLGFASRRRKS